MTSKLKGKRLCPVCRTKKYGKKYFIVRQHRYLCPECFKRGHGETFNNVLEQYEARLKKLYPKGKHPTHRLDLYRSLL